MSTTASNVPPKLGKYRLVAQLGSGGMANVYLAVMQGRSGFNKLVVLKVPQDSVANDPEAASMFLDEARIAARLSHPNIVQTFEIVHEAERDVLVMEYLDGYSLNDAIVNIRKNAGVFPMPLQLRILSEALTGLHYAHEAKDFDGAPLHFVHRDMTPHNVFLTFDGQVKLLDFGIAKAAMQTHKTEYGTRKGKIRYMPLEQLAGAEVDRRADIFAVGMMLWEAAVGERLWHKRSDVEVMTAVIGGNIPMPRDVKPEVPERLDAIVRRALSHQREDRYPTALALKHDVEAFLVEQTPNPTLRDVTSFLESTFASRRAARGKIIDDTLKSPAFAEGASVPPASSQRPPPSTVDLPVLPSFGPTEHSGGSQPSGHSSIGLSRSNVPPAATPPKRRWPLLLALLLLLGIGGGMAVHALDKDRPATASASTGTAVVTPPPSATGELASPAEKAVSAALSPTAPSPSPSPSALPSAPLATAAIVSGAPTTANARPTFTPTPPRTAIAARSAPAAPPAPAPSPDPSGTLSFTTTPWARVYEGGKLLGTTPLYKVPLSPGTHVLTLENSDEGVKTTYTVVVKSGESMTRTTALK